MFIQMNRRIPYAILCLSFLGASLQARAEEDPATAHPGYRLVFHDEFNEGEVPDPEVWQFETGFCRNHEDQYYQKPNATVKDGNLVIEARMEKVKNKDYVRGSGDWKKKDKYSTYTSASMQTRRDKGYQWSQGIYEARVFLPIFSGSWPAFWSVGSMYEWPYNGEIDMMEYYNDRIHCNVAWGGWNRWQAQWASKAPTIASMGHGFANKWHVFKMVWDDEAIRLYCDDTLVNEVNLDRTVNPNVGQDYYNRVDWNPYRDPENKQICWLNFALGGDNGGKIDESKLPAQYLVDWVRVYVPGDDTAVGEIEDEGSPETEYFTLQGLPVRNPAGGFFIKRCGAKVSKVCIPGGA